MNKDNILAALPSLSPNDLQALQAVIGELLGQKAAKVPHAQNNAQAWLYEAMAATINSHQGYDSFMASSAGKQFTKGAPDAVSFVMATFEQARGHKTFAVAIMRHLIGLLVADLRAKKVPVTRGILSVNLSRLAEVFDKANPGYANAGVATLISKALTKRK
jgi:hypothetical protein